MKLSTKFLLTIGSLLALGGTASATTITGDANTTILDPAPLVVDATSPASNTNLFGWAEQQGFTLTQNLAVNITSPGTYTGVSTDSDVLLPGTVVNSFLLHYNNETASITATFTFSSPVIALIFGTSQLDASDFLLPTGASYLQGSSRGLDDAGDIVTLSADRLSVMFTASPSGSDQIRVLTDINEVPEPGTYALIGTGIVALGFFRSRRKA